MGSFHIEFAAWSFVSFSCLRISLWCHNQLPGFWYHMFSCIYFKSVASMERQYWGVSWADNVLKIKWPADNGSLWWFTQSVTTKSRSLSQLPHLHHLPVANMVHPTLYPLIFQWLIKNLKERGHLHFKSYLFTIYGSYYTFWYYSWFQFHCTNQLIF